MWRTSSAIAGSSPLTRGKRTRHAPPDSHRWAHPRSRGENSTEGVSILASTGSSPLTRGKPRPPRVGLGISRLIPAHAGKTWSPRAPTTATWAHPRSRGENRRRTAHNSPHPGSSPLTRGKLDAVPQEARPCRLIPAHAGKTNKVILEAVVGRAHPRSRGENADRDVPDEILLGSSPLTRGKPIEYDSAPVNDGLIPAHAGKTN